MCVHCEDIEILITNPMHKSNLKYEEALEVIEKALGYSTASGAKEITPYKAVEDLMDRVKEDVEKKLLDLHNAMVRRWLGLSKADSDPFKLNGKLVLNPSTGKPLTKKEWKTLKSDMMRSFAYVFADKDEDIARTAMALGRIIADLPVDDAISVGLGNMQLGQGLRIVDTDPQYRAALQFADENAAEYIVDLSQRSYKRIHDTIVHAQQNRATTRELERKLFEDFGAMNRDWRRIAETEIATNANDGKLIAELGRDREEGEHVFVQGMSSPTACKWCWSEVNNQIVVLLDRALPGGGDTITVDGTDYTAIWPGKNNVGRARRDWWVASGTQHPHCQCTWVRYQPGYEDYFEKLNAKMAQAAEESRESIVPYTMD